MVFSPRLIFALAALCTLLVLAGCAGSGKSRGGGYYKDDGPGDNIPADIASIPDAVPRIETHARANMRPYVVFGRRYVPIADERPFRQTGVASWYGRKFHGNRTANGEIYDMYAMTAAHPTLPIPSYARVTRATSGRSVIVRINDRGPFHSGRIIDLSYAAAAKLGLIGPGSGQVIVEAITSEDIRNNAWVKPGAAPTQTAALPAPVAVPVRASPPPEPDPEPAPDTPDALAALGHADQPMLVTHNATANPSTRGAVQPEQPTPDLAAPGQIYLQFGAFSSNEAAQSLAQRLNQQLGNNAAGLARVEQGSNQLYRVQIGPFPNRTAAVNAALSVQEQTGMQPVMASR